MNGKPVGQPRICPACGALHPPSGPKAGPIELCKLDGHALVAVDDYRQADADTMLGRTVAHRFTIISRVGVGSMGAVYRAWQSTVGRWVALKIMRHDRLSDLEAKARFEREARAMSQLVSPHTVTVFDFGEAEEMIYLAMELLHGESLATRLSRTPRLQHSDGVRIIREALISLGEAHSKGIIHRDLKPDNLYLARLPDVAGQPSREVCKILDFGIAKLVGGQLDGLETQAGTVFGTPRYMSPEQAQGEPLDARSDLYSLGVILYQLVTGRVPFEDEDAVVVMARHIKTPPRPPREIAPDVGIPPSLERVILRALAKDPLDRPDSAETFLRALDAAEKSFSSTVATIPPPASTTAPGIANDPLPTLPPTVRRRRRRVLWAGLVVGGLVVAGGTGLLVGQLIGRSGANSGVPTAGSSISPSSRSSTAPSVPAASSDSAAVPAEALPVVSNSPPIRPTSRRDPTPPPVQVPSATAKKYGRFD